MQTFEMELFAKIVNGFKPITIFSISSTTDVNSALDPALAIKFIMNIQIKFTRETKIKENVTHH